MSAPPTHAIAPRLSRLFAALDGEGLRWCLLRPRESLLHEEGDVDVLVEPAARARARRVLEEEGYVALSVAGPDLHGVDYDREAGRFLWVHVQPELRVGGASVPAAAILADVEAGADGVPQPHDGWLLWILLLRALLDRKGVAERYRPLVARLAGAGHEPPAALARIAGLHGLDAALVRRLAAAGDWDGLDALVPAPEPPRRLPRRLPGGLVRRLRGLRAPTGLSVAVLGPDGAGKTTLVESLHRTLPFPTRIHYMGLTGGQIPRADRLRVPGLVLGAKLAILWARYAATEYHRRRGTVVLIDRYTLDGAVPSGVALGPLGRASRRVMRRACPLPDLVFLLDASGETMHGRKGEYDPATLETWRAAYARLVGAVPQLVVLDAEQPVDAVRREAEAAVWSRYRSRLERGRR